MRKFYVAASMIAVLSTVVVSCTNDVEGPTNPVVVAGQSGRLVFSVNAGKSVSFTKTTVGEDVAIKKVSVFVFDELGDYLPDFKQNYEGSEIVEGKLAVTVPSNLMNKNNLKVYLVANIETASVTTEQELLDLITTVSTTGIATSGIPMASAPITLNTTTPVITAEAVMKRAMSSVFVKVNPVESGGVTVNSGDFTYKVKNVRLDKGYLLKDIVCTGDVTAEATWTPKGSSNNEELLGYMYQSNGFQVEITPSVDKPELGTAPRTVVVAADKAMKRNKKYVLNVLPKISATGQIDFTVTVQEWDATDGNFNVDWVDAASINADAMVAGKIKEDNGQIILSPIVDVSGTAISYARPKSWFSLTEGSSLVSFTMSSLLDSKSQGLRLSGDNLQGTCMNINDVRGKITVETNRNGVLAKQDFPILLEGRYIGLNHGSAYGTEEAVAVMAESGNLISMMSIPGSPSKNPSFSLTPSMFTLNEGWSFKRVGGNASFSTENLTNGLSMQVVNGALNVFNIGNAPLGRVACFFIELENGGRTVVREFFIRTSDTM